MQPDLSELFTDLVRLETALWSRVDARLQEDHGLALTWFEPMQLIGRIGRCRVIDVAEALSITIGGTSKLVDRIQEAGWCLRQPNPDDGRSSIIELTDEGRQLLEAATVSFVDELGRRLGGGCSDRSLGQFAATTRTLLDHLRSTTPGSG